MERNLFFHREFLEKQALVKRMLEESPAIQFELHERASVGEFDVGQGPALRENVGRTVDANPARMFALVQPEDFVNEPISSQFQTTIVDFAGTYTRQISQRLVYFSFDFFGRDHGDLLLPHGCRENIIDT